MSSVHDVMPRYRIVPRTPPGEYAGMDRRPVGADDLPELALLRAVAVEQLGPPEAEARGLELLDELRRAGHSALELICLDGEDAPHRERLGFDVGERTPAAWSAIAHRTAFLDYEEWSQWSARLNCYGLFEHGDDAEAFLARYLESDDPDGAWSPTGEEGPPSLYAVVCVHRVRRPKGDVSGAALDELRELAAGLETGDPQRLLGVLRPLLADLVGLERRLMQMLEFLPSSAAAVVSGLLYLPLVRREARILELAADPREYVRHALFRKLAPPRLERPGGSWSPLSTGRLDELLRRGASDSSALVREAAAALAFGTARGDALSDLLLGELPSASERHRCVVLHALGTARDAASLAALEGSLDAGSLAESAAAVRALACRPDGSSALVGAFEDARGGVRAAAVDALATLATGLPDELLTELEERGAPDDLRAAIRAYRGRASSVRAGVTG